MSASPGSPKLIALKERWAAAWPKALAIWSKYTRLRPPLLCLEEKEAESAGLSGSFAAIRLTDQSIIVSLPGVCEDQLEDYAVEILAHEIGHHVLAPATLGEHARMIARMRHALPTLEAQAPMVANLYTDLLINDRLQRSAGLRLAEIYQAIGRKGGSGGAVWSLYLRIYELLWSLPKGALKGGPTNDAIEGDAWLGARIVRSFAQDWMRGAGRFAALLLPHLAADQESQKLLNRLLDTKQAGMGGDAGGLSDEDGEEASGDVHPSEDPLLTGEGADGPAPSSATEKKPTANASVKGNQPGQARQPYQYGEILRAAGIDVTQHEASVRYYRERAQPHLIPFPSRILPETLDPLPEGLEPWDIGDAPDAADWLQSVLISPHVIPGLTTVQRTWGRSEGHDPEREPLDLDLYVDCSGSMPNQQQQISYLTLAGAILSLSALRSGSRVQTTLWSGKDQVQSTPGFVRDETAILRVLTGYLGGGTAFPIHVLRETYAHRTKGDRAVHIVVISDEGVTTMFDPDEEGNRGWDVAARALQTARGGGTLLLNLPSYWGSYQKVISPDAEKLRRARDELGFDVETVSSWEDLVQFARAFSRRRFGAEAFGPAVTPLES